MLPYQTLLKIDAEDKKALYEQIAVSLSKCIKDGTIPSGTKLPSSRTLADILNLHRKTILAAYDELINQGWIIAKNRSGYYINPDIVIADTGNKGKKDNRFPDRSPVPLIAAFPVVSTNSAKRVNDVNTVFIDDGLPDARLAPYNSLLRELKIITERNYKLKKVNYGTTIESNRLRDALALHLAKSRGFQPHVSNILTTSGAQMAIYLLGKALIDKGDVVLVGSPGYSLAQQSFQNQGANVMEVPVDQDGINTDIVEDMCRRHKIKCIYVIPHHHYPTTVTLSPERRLKLLSLASTYDFMIIEDDYDYDYHYSSAPHLPMASYHHSGRVIYIGSLSKTFSASLRLGFIVGPGELIDACKYLRRSIDIRGDFVLEEAVAALFENGEMERHLRRAHKIYKERRDHFCNQINIYLKSEVSYVVPAGGMAVWAEFNKRFDIDNLAALLQKQGIVLNPNAIYNKKYNLNNMRIGFASLDVKEVERFIEGMQLVIKNYG